MNAKTRYNYWVDMLALWAMVVVTFTGFVLWGWLRPAGMSPGGEGRPQSIANAESARPNVEGKAKAPTASVDRQRSEASAPIVKEGGRPQGEARIFWGLFHGKTFLGMTKNGGWKGIHCWVSVLVLLPLMILHLISHFSWLFGRRARANDRSEVDDAVKPNEE